MTTIKEAFDRVLDKYPSARKDPLKNHPMAAFLAKETPEIIKRRVGLGEPYILQGSVGQGNWAEVPWVCVFDQDVTTSAQRGYYCVYLFNALGNSVVLSLALGWTQFDDAFPKKEASRRIVNAVKNCRSALTDKLDKFNTAAIALDVQKALGKGYELGHICSKVYHKNQIPTDDVLSSDLREMLQAYDDLKAFIGKKDVIESLVEIQKKSVLEEDAKDSTFQQMIQTSGKPVVLADGPIERGQASQSKGFVRWTRTPEIARQVCEEKSYVCEVGAHPTFVSRASNKPYVEAHHLIPVGYQDEFKYSLDVPENILILCPLCHRVFHHSQPECRDVILEKFYHERSAGLAARGIEISLAKLKEYY